MFGILHKTNVIRITKRAHIFPGPVYSRHFIKIAIVLGYIISGIIAYRIIKQPLIIQFVHLTVF